MRKNQFYICKVLVMLFIATLLFNTKTLAKVNSNDLKEIKVSALSAVAIDAKTGSILYDKGSHTILPMASTTKIATALVALKYGDLDKTVEISKNAQNVKGSKVGYKKGENITIKELLYGLLFKSGNDAAIAISEGVAGSVDGFIELMNEYALNIGLLDTSFSTPHGLDKEEHYSTAYDLALLTVKAKENETFSKIVSSKSISKDEMKFTRDYNNINKLLWQIPEANGVKTGYTGNAGKCLVSSISYDNNDVIIVVLNCNERWKETKNIYDYVCRKYEYKKIFSKDDIVKEVEIKDGIDKIGGYIKEDIVVPIEKGGKEDVNVVINENIKAPIKKDDIIGSIIIKSQEKIIYEGIMYSKEDVNSISNFKKFKNKLFK